MVVKPDAVAGKLQRSFYNIPVGTPVGVGLGDFQCSVLASVSQQSDAGDVNTLISESMVSFPDSPFKFPLLPPSRFLDPLVSAFGILKLLHPVRPKQRM